MPLLCKKVVLYLSFLVSKPSMIYIKKIVQKENGYLMWIKCKLSVKLCPACSTGITVLLLQHAPVYCDTAVSFKSKRMATNLKIYFLTWTKTTVSVIPRVSTNANRLFWSISWTIKYDICKYWDVWGVWEHKTIYLHYKIGQKSSFFPSHPQLC